MRTTDNTQRVVGLDLDNTFGDFTGALREFIAEASGLTPDETHEHLPEPDAYCMGNWNWDKTVFPDFGTAFKVAEQDSHIYSQMRAFTGAAEAVNHIRTTFNTSIHVVSARPAIHEKATLLALSTWGIADIVDRVCLTTEKHLYPADVFVDDAPGQLESFSAHNISAVAFHHRYNADSPSTARMMSWQDSVDAVETALDNC